MSGNEGDALDENDLIVCNGCCCFHQDLYCQMPECIGCSGKEECLCLAEQWCCKMGTSPLLCKNDDEAVCCQLGCGCYAIGCKRPSTCCKVQGQCCCIVEMCAFPCDKEIPAVMALYGLMCYPQCGCCKKIGEINGQVAAGAPETVHIEPLAAPVATRPEVYKPAQLEMTR